MNPFTIRVLTACLVLLVAAPATAKPKKSEQANIDAVKAALSAVWNDGDIDSIDRNYGGDFDKAAAKKFAAETTAQYTDMKLSFGPALADDAWVSLSWTMNATHQSGIQIEIPGLSLARVEGGTIVESQARYDSLPVWQTLGVDPFELASVANSAAVDGIAAAYNGDIATLDQWLADGATMSLNGGEAEPFNSTTVGELLKAWSAHELVLHDKVARGDQVAVPWTFTGTAAATGEEITFHGTWVGRFADGKLVESSQAYDVSSVRAKLAPPEMAKKR